LYSEGASELPHLSHLSLHQPSEVIFLVLILICVE
jgi:hypothetical protein